MLGGCEDTRWSHAWGDWESLMAAERIFGTRIEKGMTSYSTQNPARPMGDMMILLQLLFVSCIR